MESEDLKNPSDLIPPVDYQFNIGVYGDGDVGKSSLLDSFASNVKFNMKRDHKTTTKTCSNIVKIGDNKTVRLWVSKVAFCNDEILGGNLTRAISRFDGIVLVYDWNNVRSYSKVEEWIREIDDVCPGIPKILVGNKCDSRSDLKRVHASTAQNFAKEMHMQFLETSAKNSMNVKQAFTAIAAELRRKMCSQTKEVKLTPEGLVARNWIADLMLQLPEGIQWLNLIPFIFFCIPFLLIHIALCFY